MFNFLFKCFNSLIPVSSNIFSTLQGNPVEESVIGVVQGIKGREVEEEDGRKEEEERQGEGETVSSTYRQLSPHRDKYKEGVRLYACVCIGVCTRQF